MKRLLPILLFSLVTSIVSSQPKKVYLDENNHVISKLIFLQKENSSIYYKVYYDMDSVTYKKVYISYYIGKLDNVKKDQLLSTLAIRNSIDTSKTIVIHYQDTLKNIISFPKKDTLIRLSNGGHKHLSSHRTFLKKHKNCLKENRKKNVELVHFFNTNMGHPTSIKKKYKWEKDNNMLLKKIFSNRDDSGLYWHLVIHPDGRFFTAFGSDLDDKIYKDLLRDKNWNIYHADFVKKYNALNPKTTIPNSVR